MSTPSSSFPKRDSNKSLPTDREVPKPVRFITRGFVYRSFPWRERIKILLGYSLLAEIHIASEHNPGQSQPMTRFHLTAEKTQATALLELRRQVEAEQADKGVTPNSLPEGKE